MADKSSARPDNLLHYSAGMYGEAEIVKGKIASIRQPLADLAATCGDYVGTVPDLAQQVEEAVMLAEELDAWVGVIGKGFLLADTSGADWVQDIDDSAVIANIPPGLADPPSETRAHVQEGQDLYNDLKEACDNHDHDRINELLEILNQHEGDPAFLAGFASMLPEENAEQAFQDMLKEGMKTPPRGGPFGWAVDLLEGAWDTVWGTVEFVWGLTAQVLYDPSGWGSNWADLGEGLWYGVTHPLEFAKALIDVDGFLENPARWLGSFVPDIILTVFTAGGGAVRRGEAGLEGLRDLDRLADAARDLDRLADTARHADDLGDLSHLDDIVAHLDPDLRNVRNALRDKLIAEGKPPDVAEAIANRITAGTQFNRDNWQRYTDLGGYNEVRLGTGRVLDSYVPNQEIVSRKLTQLSEIQPSTARGYISELANKYPDGTEIARSPSTIEMGIYSIDDPPGTVRTINGQLVLEVPPQVGTIPQDVLDFARSRQVTIRTTDGVVLTP